MNILKIRDNEEIHNKFATPYGDVYINWIAKHNSIRLSGGFDSAVVLYLLAKTLNDKGNNDAVIHPFTVQRANPPCIPEYDRVDCVAYAKKIIEWVRGEFPNVEICDTIIEPANYWWVHRFVKGQNISSYNTAQETVSNYLRWEYGEGHADRFPASPFYATPEKLLYCEYTGLTQNPPLDALPQCDEAHRDESDPLVVIKDSITVMHEHHKLSPWYHLYEPFRNGDKRVPFWLADDLGILNKLLKITRSCEGNPVNTKNFTKECGECWWCLERKWGYENFARK